MLKRLGIAALVSQLIFVAGCQRHETTTPQPSAGESGTMAPATTTPAAESRQGEASLPKPEPTAASVAGEAPTTSSE
jgi:hypothetical protein